jgi:exodeoxyribonuclease VII small subunit
MPSNKKDKSPSFEHSLEELENMVETMESGQLPLEELISNYERGAKLISHCETVLDDARKRLELLTLKPSTSEDSSDQNLTLDAESATNNNDNNDDDEIRLF